MLIAITASGLNLDADLDPRFGRAACFLLVDPQTENFQVLDNPASHASGGAGIAAAQAILDQGVAALVTGQLGPNAMQVLSGSGIDLYQGQAGSVRGNIQAFREGRLLRITSTGPSHFGLGGRFSGQP